LLQKHYASDMLFCLVYEKAQNHLLATAKCLAATKNILQNVVVLDQYLWFIENRETISSKNIRLDEKNILESNHNLGFMGYGIDDFMSKEKRRLPIFDWFETTFMVDNTGVFFSNVDILSQLMNL
jgi:hypothetical protein